MSVARKKVIVLFSGGATLVGDDGVRLDVEKQVHVKRWLQKVPELNLIADIDPQFLFAGDAEDVQPAWWEAIARTVAKHFSRAEGFIITQPVTALPFTAAALSFLLRDVGKPVVLTGGSDLRASGIRANLVNAMQVVTADFGEVVVLFGNRVLRGSRVVRQAEPGVTVFSSAGPSSLGRIDFGLKLEAHRRPRTNKPPRLSLGMTTNVLHIAYAPGVTAVPVATVDRLDGIFVSHAPASGLPPALQTFLRSALRKRVPVALHFDGKRKRAAEFLSANNMTATAAYVKFLWALKRANTTAALQKLLDADIAGEHIEP